MFAPQALPNGRWRHQQAAFEFVERLWKTGRHGAMLALCMGAGKSRVAIDLATAFGLAFVLVLCPLRVVEPWRRQFLRYGTKEHEFLALDDRVESVSEKTRLARELLAWAAGRSQPQIVIAINYESARTEPFASWALRIPWSLVIADESHRLKQPGGRTARFAGKLGLRSRYRLALSGTPMAHQPLDVYGQYRFLDPTIFDLTFGSFQRRYSEMGGYFGREITGWRNLDELHQKFYSIAYRVTEEVLDLPPELDETLSVRLSPGAAQLYHDMEEQLVAWIDEGSQVTAANAMVRLLRLQQITGGTLADDAGEEHIVDRAKEELLADWLSDLAGTEPVVVFARFRSDLRAVHRAAAAAGMASGELSGERDELAAWQRGAAGDPSLLAVQIQAGGVGVDLTRARYAVYYSLGFSLTDYLQSRARVRRPPQQRPVTYYHLVAEASIDQGVRRAIERRQDLIESILEELKCPQPT